MASGRRACGRTRILGVAAAAAALGGCGGPGTVRPPADAPAARAPATRPAATALRLVYRVDPDPALDAGLRTTQLERTVSALERRLAGRPGPPSRVYREGERVVVELAGGGAEPEEQARLQALLGRVGCLELWPVEEDSSFMRAVTQRAASDEIAQGLGIEVERDAWMHDGTGVRRADVYLVGRARRPPSPRDPGIGGDDVLAGYLANLADEDPRYRLDADHRIAYEELSARLAPPGAARRWRAYYLVRDVAAAGCLELDGAEATLDGPTNQPQILVELAPAGARMFEDLTRRLVGRKLAILLDGRVAMAPIVQTAIPGGRLAIGLGHGESGAIDQDAEDLATLLRSGPLPARVRLDEVSVR